MGDDKGRWLAQPLLIEGETVGHVLARAERRGDDVTELALAQVVLVAALFHLEQRAASRASTAKPVSTPVSGCLPPASAITSDAAPPPRIRIVAAA